MKFHVSLAVVTLIMLSLSPSQKAISQVLQTPTPITVNLITSTPFNAQQSVATVTPTFTPTPKGPVLLEVKEASGVVNVRAEPDPNSERLGSIEFGTQYPVLRQYFLWYEFQYDLSPSGRAWVYGELVDILGDAFEIEVVDTLNETVDDPTTSITETWVALALVSGGLETATANARVLDVPTIESNFNQNTIILTPLPTFTYPADSGSITNLTDTSNVLDESEDFALQTPPIFSILMLGGFGVLGLLINALRS